MFENVKFFFESRKDLLFLDKSAEICKILYLRIVLKLSMLDVV